MPSDKIWRSLNAIMLMETLAADEARYLEVDFVAPDATAETKLCAIIKDANGTLVSDKINRKVFNKVLYARFVFRDTSVRERLIYRITEKGKIWAKAKLSLSRAIALTDR